MKKLFVLFLLCVFSGLWLQTEQTRGAEPENCTCGRSISEIPQFIT